MKLSLTIHMGGAAFADEPGYDDYNAAGVAFTLCKLADHISGSGGRSGHLIDYNGNQVGSWTIK